MTSTDHFKVAWKRFWMQNQRYETICLQCISKSTQQTKSKNMQGTVDDSEKEEESGAHPAWGPVYLNASSKAILMKWYRKAQESVWGKKGRRRPTSIEFSDDEGEDVPPGWVVSEVALTDASKALAIRWLRTARARLQEQRDRARSNGTTDFER